MYFVLLWIIYTRMLHSGLKEELHHTLHESMIHYIYCVLLTFQSFHKVTQQFSVRIFCCCVQISIWCLTVIVVWQTEIAGVMRQGMAELLRYEKRPEQKRKVYTYEKAVER